MNVTAWTSGHYLMFIGLLVFGDLTVILSPIMVHHINSMSHEYSGIQSGLSFFFPFCFRHQ